MIITEQQKNQLNKFLREYGFNIISGNELTTEIVNQAKTGVEATPLYIAAQKGHIEIVKALIEAGAEIDKATTDVGATPLCIAAQEDHIEIVKVLIEAGAEIDKAETTYGSTPLFIAACNGHIEIVKALMEAGAEIDKARTDNGATPLFFAAQNSHIEIVKALIEAGAEIDKARTDNGVTPLFMALSHDHTETMRLLLEKGADVNYAITSGIGKGQTPLFITAFHGHTAKVQLLLEAGADVNHAVTSGISKGQSPLYVAAYNGHTAIARLLLESGANVNQANNSGATPLNIAELNGHTATAQLLLFATKLSSKPNIRLTFSQIMNEDPIIRQILDCDQQGQFNSLRNNLKLIAQADKAGLRPDEYNSLGYVRRLFNNFNFFQNTKTRNITTHQINTSQIVLKALYEHFSRGENLPELLETFTTKTTPLALLNRFNLNNPESLLTLLSKVVSKKEIPTAVNADIAEFAGAFSNKRLDTLLEAHFNGKEAKDLIKVAAEADKARALTQETILAVAELITKLKSLSSLPDNITENGDGTYKYHYDAENGAAELATKPLSELTESELANLYSEIQRLEAAQPARQEAEERDPEPSHARRLAEQRAQEKARESKQR